MDEIVLLSRDPVALTVFAIAGLAFGIAVARKFLRSKRVQQRHHPLRRPQAPFHIA